MCTDSKALEVKSLVLPPYVIFIYMNYMHLYQDCSLTTGVQAFRESYSYRTEMFGRIVNAIVTV